jgi:hypothetical protein
LRPLPFSKRVADHIIGLEQAPELALDRANLAVACVGCNTRRGRNAKLPDLERTGPSGPVSVGARMAAILDSKDAA